MNQVFKSNTKQVSEFKIHTKTEEMRFVQMEAQCLYEQNTPSQCLLVVIDITLQKEAEQELQEEKAFSENLLENSIDGIFAFDSGSRITAWNKVMKELTGIYKQETLGRNIFDLFPAYRVNEERNAIRQALQGKSSVLYDHPYGLSNGFYEVYTLPLLLADPGKGQQKVSGGVSMVHDVTERIRLKLQGQKELLNAIL